MSGQVSGRDPQGKPRLSNPAVGLCFDCRHARQVDSSRGSVFYPCQLSETDPGFPKYPRLPVIACRGFEPSGDESS